MFLLIYYVLVCYLTCFLGDLCCLVCLFGLFVGFLVGCFALGRLLSIMLVGFICFALIY